MTAKAKIDPNAAPSSAAATKAMKKWHQNRQNPRATVPSKQSRGTPLDTLKFDGTFNGLKDRGLVFGSFDPRADRFTHIRRKITEYVGKD